MKAGFGIASESTMRPQLINSFVGRPKYSRSMIGATRCNYLDLSHFVGDNLISLAQAQYFSRKTVY